MTLQAKVLTVSDSVFQRLRADQSGPALVRSLEGLGFRVVEHDVVGDGIEPVAAALDRLSSSFCGLVATAGGTGFSPTDLTPEATRTLVDREAPGLAELVRSSSPLGPLSRGVAGTVGSCLIVNLPGSKAAAVESIEALADILPHALDLLAGGTPH
jgi:molybdopterin adenylyltransferase